MKPDQGITESALYVADLDRSVSFYRDVLGLEPMSEPAGRLCAMEVTPHQVLLLFVKGGSVQDTVTPTGRIPATDGDGHLHMAFGVSTAQLEAWRERLAAHGLEMETMVWPEGGESIYFWDPDGHVIELKTSNWRGALFD
jgi:catechol 2,3-dioxygenase-like lactoylglutathione lyase family enzyme